MNVHVVRIHRELNLQPGDHLIVGNSDRLTIVRKGEPMPETHENHNQPQQALLPAPAPSPKPISPQPLIARAKTANYEKKTYLKYSERVRLIDDIIKVFLNKNAVEGNHYLTTAEVIEALGITDEANKDRVRNIPRSFESEGVFQSRVEHTTNMRTFRSWTLMKLP